MLEKIILKGIDNPRYPLIQGGMGAGISLMRLASAVSNEDAMGTISSVALDKFTSARVGKELNQVEAVAREIEDTKKASNFAAINIMVKLEGSYKNSIEGAVRGGANMILSGAGLPVDLPRLVEEYAGTKDHKISLVPIVSSARALKVLLNYWIKRNGYLPDAIVLEGPKAGGHLGFSYKEIRESGSNFLKDYDLFDVLLDPVLEITRERNIPVFVAGGIRTKEDILYAKKRGAAGVQIATPFIATYESGASDSFKQAIIDSNNEDVLTGSEEWGSPALFPFRYLKSSPLAEKKNGRFFCICSALLSSTDMSFPQKKGDCPELYVKPLKCDCPAKGNVLYDGVYTSGTEINSITRIRHAAEIIRELVEE
jgi:nitronate monooxygenase